MLTPKPLTANNLIKDLDLKNGSVSTDHRRSGTSGS